MDQFSIVTGKVNNTIYVRVSKAKTGEFGIITRQTGFIEVDGMGNAQALLEKLESKELATAFGSTPNQQGNYDVKVLPVGELEHA